MRSTGNANPSTVLRAFGGRAARGTRIWNRLLALVLLLAPLSSLFAEGTDNHELHAVPPPKAVVIDGKLDDWDLSGRIVMCSDVAQGLDQFSGSVAMMYDPEALYVAVDWNDATPMVNNYDPDYDIDRRKCFHSDSLQIHFNTDQKRKVIGWWYTKEKRPGVICLNGWMPWHDKPIVYIDGQKELGITEAFQPKPDGSGYTQELRVPWKAIVKSGRAYQAGERFDCMLDLVWGPDSGKGWPVNHMMDLVKPGAVHTGWFWEVNEIYGQVVLEKEGHLKLPQPEFLNRKKTEPHRIAGTIPLRAELPEGDVARFALAIEDLDGKRIRTLPGDCDPTTYASAEGGRHVEVLWDGLDDRGRLAKPGEYRVTGLTRGALGAYYDICFYNPGTPPWGTADGRGAWGADHTPPRCVAASGDFLVLGWAGAEGGCGIIGVGPDGQKQWGEHQGATALATDEQNAFFMLSDSWAGKSGLARISVRKGTYQPLSVNGKPELPVSLETIFGEKTTAEVTALAVHGQQLVMALTDGVLAVLDKDAAKLLAKFRTPWPKALAFSNEGVLYAVCEGKVQTIDLKDGSCTPVPLDGIAQPTALAVDKDGRLAVSDMGSDRQIKVFGKDGAFLYAVGRKGGRPLRGRFDPEAMSAVHSIAFDAKGQLWAVESWELPRRVSVWGTDGKLVRDYIGNTAYSACGTFVHDQDPTLAYAGPVEMKLDRAAHRWDVTQILWAPDRSKGECFEISSSLALPQRFRSNVSGAMHEYVFTHSWHGESGFTIFMPHGESWQPASAICYVGHVAGCFGDNGVEREPAGEFAGLNAYDGLFWSDRNGDGRVQRNECEIVPAAQPGAKGKGGRGPFALANGWGGKIGRDLTIYADGIVVHKPLSFTADGAPIYDPTGMQQTDVKDHGDLIPVDDGQHLLVLSATGYGEDSYLRVMDIATWQELWRYPSFGHGVHGSHKVSMPEPGKVIGALKVLGVAKVNDEVGSVFAIRGNLGEDFLLTTDGYYVGTLFRDSRLPGPSLTGDEADWIGKSIGDLTEGSEPFNGWFGKQDDGKVRIMTGIPGQAALLAEVRGLETIRRFKGGTFKVTQADMVRCEQENAARKAAAGVRKRVAIARIAQPPAIDGDGGDWKKGEWLNAEKTGSSERAHIKLSYDDTNLYLLADVEDASPWRNEGKDYARPFKTGDAVDLQFSTATLKGGGAADASQVRLVFSQLEGKPVCVLMMPMDPAAPKESSYVYKSPVGERRFARVEVLTDAQVAVRVEGNRYRLEAAVPLEKIGLKPTPGMTIRGDAGFISSDANGTLNVARTYWSNAVTNLTNDLPLEAWLYPETWGEWVFE